MRKILLILGFTSLLTISGFAQQVPLACEQSAAFDHMFGKKTNPDLGIVIYSNDPETVWNALRLATYAQGKGDLVVIFLLGKGVDGYQTKDPHFDLEPLKDTYVRNGGQIIACATCAAQRGQDEIALCTISSISDLYSIIHRSKKVISF
jgi:sulfur relay (sulfurtransferase) complex TusBCD TusD component (DsrE family)